MKNFSVWLIGIFLFAAGCDHEPIVNPAIDLVSFTKCKNRGLKSAADHSTNQDCIQYTWVKGDTLKIKHVNAGFNCCPEGFRTELKVSGDTLIITEFENSSLCDCNCLYDLDYNLTGISKGIWWIKVVEPYVQIDAEKFSFRVDLSNTDAKEYCITRTGFPWGM